MFPRVKFNPSSFSSRMPQNRVQLRGCSAQIKTFALQSELPPLPVPDLQESCKVYIQSVRPLTNPDEFANTQRLVDKFLTEQGPILHQRLLEHTKHKNSIGESWLEKWWLDAAYLTFREPLPTNSNYYLVFDELKQNDQSVTAGKLIRGALQYREKLIKQEIPVQFLRKTTPQCMNQYTTIFNVSRIAKDQIDELRPIENSKHIAVLVRGQVYILQVLNDQEVPFQESEIIASIQSILKESEKHGEENVPSITTIHRDNSAKIRALLEKKNAKELELVDNALFAISLDAEQPGSLSETGALLNAGNSRIAKNRWYEKVINFVVFKNGLSGLTGEHAPLDAPMVGNVADWIVPQIQNETLVPTGSSGIPPFKKINWNLDGPLQNELSASEKEAIAVLNNCETVILKYQDFGAQWIKSVARASPDAFMQMSIQLAYYYLHLESSATYETGTARGFFHGRTETVRTLSTASQEWTHSMLNRNVSAEERLAKLQAAIDNHSAYMKRATDGKAIDRHFLGLRKMLQPGEPMPDIFTDPVWKQSVRFRISTSNMTGNAFIAGFGGTENDGYGICYGSRENLLYYSVSSFNNCEKTSAPKFVESLRRALDSMRALYKEPAKL